MNSKRALPIRDQTKGNSRNSHMRGPNFRTVYLDFLGFEGFQPLLHVDIIDIPKLRKICIKCDVPSHHKSIIWKILLGVFPAYKDSWSFVDEQNTQHYNDLKRATALIRYGQLNEQITPEQGVENCEENTEEMSKIISDVWITQQSFSFHNTEDDLDLPDLIKISRVFCNVCANEVNAYWCLSKFLNHAQQDKITKGIVKLFEFLVAVDNELATFFTTHEINLEDFADRLWDKLISTSSELDVQVALSVLTRYRTHILGEMDFHQLTHQLRNLKIKENEADIVIAKALEYLSLLNNEELVYSTQSHKKHSPPPKIPWMSQSHQNQGQSLASSLQTRKHE